MKNSPSKYILELEVFFNGLSKQLKTIVSLVSLFVLFYIWQYFASILFFKSSTNEHKIKLVETETTALAKFVKQIQMQKPVDLIEQLEDKKQSLTQQLNKMEAELLHYQSSLVSEKEMFTVIKKVIHENANIELTSFKHEPKKKLIAISQGALYENPIEMTLTGDYGGVYRYFKNIESRDINLYWDEMDYGVTAYPEASVRLYYHIITLEGDQQHAAS